MSLLKKTGVVLFILSAFFMLACPDPEPPLTNWTILVHFAIDNNIDYSFEENFGLMTNYLNTLESIEANDTDDMLDIVVLMDCYNQSGYDSPFEDGYFHLTGGDFMDDLEVPFAEINSGSVDDGKAFIDWAVENYPAGRHFYSIFNHGSGFDDLNIEGTYGIGFDDSDDDSLSHNEVSQLASYLAAKTHKKIDLLYMYACLMGGVELAWEVRDSADYLMFSEEVFPAEEWSYEALDVINSDPFVSGGDIGQAFCDSADDYFTNTSYRTFTLSVIDLAEIGDLYNSIDSFGAAAAADIIADSDNTDYYAESVIQTQAMYTEYYIDLGHYMTNIIASGDISSSVKTLAQQVANDIDAAVYCLSENGNPNATGLTIFHNPVVAGSSYSLTFYQNLLTFSDNAWVDYLVEMDGTVIIPPGDSYEPDNSFAEAKPITVDAPPQSHTLNIINDYDYMQVTLAAGNNYKIETYFNFTSTDTYLHLYDSGYHQLGSDDDDGSGLYSRIDFSCTTDGTYYIMARGYSGSTGDYLIDVLEGTFAPDPNPGLIPEKNY